MAADSPVRAHGAVAALVPVSGAGRFYLECDGEGSPTVVLIAGYRASAADWHHVQGQGLSVMDRLRGKTRVCAYDRPGTPVGDGPSRSDSVAQPTTAGLAVEQLQALLVASGGANDYVLVGHSYGGLIARLFAQSHPSQVRGLVLVDALGPGLQDAQTPRQWAVQRVLAMGDIAVVPPDYPALERVDIDQSFAQVRAAAPLRALPLAVMSADQKWAPLIPPLIRSGRLSADTPPDFGHVVDRAQMHSQAELASLVPGAQHITDTHSGHNIHHEQAALVADTVVSVVDAVRAGRLHMAR